MEEEILNLLRKKREGINSLKELLKGEISQGGKEKVWDWLITSGHLYREGKVEEAQDMAMALAEYLQEEEKAKGISPQSKVNLSIGAWFKSLKEKLENILDIIRKFKL